VCTYFLATSASKISLGMRKKWSHTAMDRVQQARKIARLARNQNLITPMTTWNSAKTSKIQFKYLANNILFSIQKLIFQANPAMMAINAKSRRKRPPPSRPRLPKRSSVELKTAKGAMIWNPIFLLLISLPFFHRCRVLTWFDFFLLVILSVVVLMKCNKC